MKTNYSLTTSPRLHKKAKANIPYGKAVRKMFILVNQLIYLSLSSHDLKKLKGSKLVFFRLSDVYFFPEISNKFFSAEREWLEDIPERRESEAGDAIADLETSVHTLCRSMTEGNKSSSRGMILCK